MPVTRFAFTVAITTLAACSSPTTSGNERLDAYRQSFHAAAGDTIVADTARDDIAAELRDRRILWLGDHHRHARLHALHLELLEQLKRRGTAMALGLEAIGVQDQPDVDAFLAREIDMRELQRRLRRRWDGSWLDDRELDPWYYRSLLEFAFRHQVPVFALEPTPRGPLAQRDATIANSVAQALDRYPDRLLVNIVGQSHLLGQGGVANRVGVDGIVLGAEPSAELAASAGATPRGRLLRSSGGVLWFAEMFR